MQFQRHKDYGRMALHDEELEIYLDELYQTYSKEPTFVETLLEVAERYDENPSTNAITSLNLDYDQTPSDPVAFFYNSIALARVAPNAAAACLDTSSISNALYNPATGGVKEVKRPYRAAFFIDRYVSRVREMCDREETPFAVLQALTAGPLTVNFTKYVSRYEIFIGPQETDGRIQAPSFPDQNVARGVLFCLTLAEHPSLSTQQKDEMELWLQVLRSELELAEATFDEVISQYRLFAAKMNPSEKANAMMCTMSGRFFVIETPLVTLGCYYWDPESLKEVRDALSKYGEDINGPKLYGYRWRWVVSWSLVFSGFLLAVLSGALNWGGRESKFERVNDVFQTFLLALSLPAFTVKIASPNGEQAIKDWLVGARRISNVEELEKQIHRRLSCNKRRGWLAIQRVKCEMDDKQNWTASDNMCYKTGHLDGSLHARKDRNMSELELVIGTNGKTARSWIEVFNETNIIGKDVNHLQFTCGTTNVQKTSPFFSHTPSKRVWFA